MLEGKIFLGLTGKPMRNSALANRLLALAEPVPLTLANLITKSFTADIGATEAFMLLVLLWSPSRSTSACPMQWLDSARHTVRNAGRCFHLSPSPSWLAVLPTHKDLVLCYSRAPSACRAEPIPPPHSL